MIITRDSVASVIIASCYLSVSIATYYHPSYVVSGFVLPQQRHRNVPSRNHYSRPLSLSTTSPTSISSEVGEQEAGNDNHKLYQSNLQLDKLAEECGDFSKPVIDLATQCQNQWEQMQFDHESDVVSFNTVLKAWCKCCHVLAENKHQQLDHNYFSKVATVHPELEAAAEEKALSAATTTTPTAPTINVDVVITAKDAAERATSLLLHQESLQHKEQHKHKNDDDTSAEVKKFVDTTSYNIVMDAWAKSRCDEAPQMGEKLLKRMLDHETIQPDIISYHTVMDAWAHHSSATPPTTYNPRNRNNNGPPGADNNNNIVSTSDSTSFDKVNQIYHHIQKLYETDKTMKMGVKTYNCVIHAHAKRAKVIADGGDFNAAYDTANVGYDLLQEMEAKYKETNDIDYKPDIVTYTSVMDGFAQCRMYRSTQRCEAIFRSLFFYRDKLNRLELSPNTKTYTTLIMAWSKTRSDVSTSRVDELLSEMEDEYFNKNNTDLLPNSRTYTAAIQTWAKSRHPKKAMHALDILKRMKKYADDYNIDEMRPTIVTYNAAIDACARTTFQYNNNDKNKNSNNSENVVDKPTDIITLQTQALKIALAIFKSCQLDKHLTSAHGSGANHVTYSTLMKAVSILLPNGSAESNEVSTLLFNKAKKAGMINFSFLRNFRSAADTKVINELLADIKDPYTGKYDYNTIPASWTRNTT